MATYIFGDVQGCFTSLKRLLDHINYDARKDRLGFVGDIVNRGPESLETLRFVMQLKEPIVVLGNHEIYALMVAKGFAQFRDKHTLSALYSAADVDTLLDWIRRQPLLVAEDDFVVVHAGIPPQWSLAEAKEHALELSEALCADSYLDTLAQLEGKTPHCWSESLQGVDRLRYITNALTRMRFCQEDGELEFKHRMNTPPPGRFRPWFEWPRRAKNVDIIFGHWASLLGRVCTSHTYALDTGCGWGHALTALRLEDRQRFTVPA